MGYRPVLDAAVEWRWMFRICVALCVLLLTVVHAQPPHPGHAMGPVVPTVTADMGEVGGTFFGRTPDPARTRHYYIAAQPQEWDYAPLGRDPVFDSPLPPPLAAKRQGVKMRYVQYTDDTFQARVIHDPRLGVLGPVLRGAVGDFLAVTFLNRTDRPLSLHPHGVMYDKDSEGAYYQPKPGR